MKWNESLCFFGYFANIRKSKDRITGIFSLVNMQLRVKNIRFKKKYKFLGAITNYCIKKLNILCEEESVSCNGHAKFL
jgi:hypothetical protein